MGMDATVSIWVGVKDDLYGSLLKLEGGDLQFFYCSGEKCGFGIAVLYHDWDFGTRELNVDNLVAVIEVTKRRLSNIFVDNGINSSIKVWYNTDYS